MITCKNQNGNKISFAFYEDADNNLRQIVKHDCQHKLFHPVILNERGYTKT